MLVPAEMMMWSPALRGVEGLVRRRWAIRAPERMRDASMGEMVLTLGGSLRREEAGRMAWVRQVPRPRSRGSVRSPGEKRGEVEDSTRAMPSKPGMGVLVVGEVYFGLSGYWLFRTMRSTRLTGEARKRTRTESGGDSAGREGMGWVVSWQVVPVWARDCAIVLLGGNILYEEVE